MTLGTLPRPTLSALPPLGLDLLRDLIGDDLRARRHAPMNAPGSPRGKYTTVHQALTDAQLAEHLRGDRTYAGYLIGSDGLARAGLIELDADALEGARRVQEAAAVAGVTIVSFVSRGAAGHDGSHNWALFDERYRPDDIARQLQTIARVAGYDNVEIWPKGNAIRLPFGVHTHTKRRGRLLLPSGELFDLDEGELRAGIRAVMALPRNSRPPAVPKVEQRRTTTIDTTAGGVSSIAEFNRTHDLKQMLEAHGYEFNDKGTSACSCGGHDRKGNRPMQLFQTNKSGWGTYVAQSYSPDCKVAPAHRSGKVLDAFGYEAYLRGMSPEDLAAELWPKQDDTAEKQAEPATPQLNPEQLAARRKDAARKRDARRREAAEAQQAIRARAATDDTLSTRARKMLDVHLDIAGTRGWHRASVARQAELYGCEERNVQAANRELLDAGYLRRDLTSGATTAFWTFTPSAPVETSENAPSAPVLYLDQDPLSEPENTCERAPDPPAGELPAGYRVRPACGRYQLWRPNGDCTWHATEARAHAAAWEAAGPAAVAPKAETVSEIHKFCEFDAADLNAWEYFDPFSAAYDLDLEADNGEPVDPDSRDSEVSAGAAACEYERSMDAGREGDRADVPGRSLLADRAGGELLRLSGRDGARVQADGESEPGRGETGRTGGDGNAQLDVTAHGGASYDPSADWTAGGVLRLDDWRDPTAPRTRDDAPEPAPADDDGEPLVRCPPADPAAAREYWTLKNKKPASAKQAKWIRMRLAELEEWRPAAEAGQLLGLPRRRSGGQASAVAPPHKQSPTSGLVSPPIEQSMLFA